MKANHSRRAFFAETGEFANAVGFLAFHGPPLNINEHQVPVDGGSNRQPVTGKGILSTLPGCRVPHRQIKGNFFQQARRGSWGPQRRRYWGNPAGTDLLRQ